MDGDSTRSTTFAWKTNDDNEKSTLPPHHHQLLCLDHPTINDQLNHIQPWREGRGIQRMPVTERWEGMVGHCPAKAVHDGTYHLVALILGQGNFDIDRPESGIGC